MGGEDTESKSEDPDDAHKECVKSQLKKKIIKKMVRDPELYEFSEFL